MKAIIFEEVPKKIFQFSHKFEKKIGCLSGRILDEGDVVQVVEVVEVVDGNEHPTPLIPKENRLSFASRMGIQLETIGMWVYGFQSDELSLKREILAATRFGAGPSQRERIRLILTLSGNESNFRIRCYSFEENKTPSDVDFEIADFSQRLFERTRKIVDSSHLSSKTVAIIGLGSGGSRVALELAKCGVGTLKLVDYDRIEVENVARHVCGLFDLGRLKTRAVRDRVIQYNPLINVETYEIDVLENQERFAGIIEESDVVVAATGSPVVNNLTNELCLRHNIPAIYAGAWEKAMAGYIMRVIPGETPCFNCVHEILLKNTPPLDQERIVDYSIVSDPSELKAEPGLGIDVGIITLLQAKLTLLTLLRGVVSDLEDIRQNYILWLNKSYNRFEPLSCLKLHTYRKDDCSVCNYDTWLKKKRKELEHS